MFLYFATTCFGCLKRPSTSNRTNTKN